MPDRFEVIERKSWVNRDTGERASIYGANPFWGGNRGAWEIVADGYTLRDTRTQEVGRPYGLVYRDQTDRADIQALADILNG